MALGLGSAAVSQTDRRDAASRDPAAALAARAAALNHQMDLVTDDARYLLLDAERGTLTLFHGAAVLRTWPVERVEAGARRFRSTDPGWREKRWEAARMEPPVRRDRRLIVSDAAEPPDPSGAVDWIPPTPEEAIPAPNRFVVHYADRMGLEVLTEESEEAPVRPGPLARAKHRVLRLLPGNWDTYRVRVWLPAAEAGALYRSLPDSTAFLAILPPFEG